jgi:hypothetical protein
LGYSLYFIARKALLDIEILKKTVFLPIGFHHDDAEQTED